MDGRPDGWIHGWIAQLVLHTHMSAECDVHLGFSCCVFIPSIPLPRVSAALEFMGPSSETTAQHSSA